jgi:hypothetical protein
MLDLMKGSSYEGVYSIGRVLLADRSKHQVLSLVKLEQSSELNQEADLLVSPRTVVIKREMLF